MAKTPKPDDVTLTAEEPIVLFVAAVGIEPASVGIVARRMQAMLIRVDRRQ